MALTQDVTIGYLSIYFFLGQCWSLPVSYAIKQGPSQHGRLGGVPNCEKGSIIISEGKNNDETCLDHKYI